MKVWTKNVDWTLSQAVCTIEIQFEFFSAQELMPWLNMNKCIDSTTTLEQHPIVEMHHTKLWFRGWSTIPIQNTYVTHNSLCSKCREYVWLQPFAPPMIFSFLVMRFLDVTSVLMQQYWDVSFGPDGRILPCYKRPSKGLLVANNNTVPLGCCHEYHTSDSAFSESYSWLPTSMSMIASHDNAARHASRKSVDFPLCRSTKWHKFNEQDEMEHIH